MSGDKAPPAERIPYESITDGVDVKPWSLPQLSDGEKVVKCAPKKKPNRRPGERVEEVSGVVKSEPITAEQLQNITEQAHKEGVEKGYKEGFERGLGEGRNTGRKQGEARAFKECQQQLTDQSERLANIASQLLVPANEQLAELERIVVEMASHYAKALIAREIAAFPQALLDQIQYVLAALPVGAEQVSVHLATADAELVDTLLPVDQRSWRVHVDDTISRGGCRVSSRDSVVDFSVDKRLHDFMTQVREAEAEETNLGKSPAADAP